LGLEPQSLGEHTSHTGRFNAPVQRGITFPGAWVRESEENREVEHFSSLPENASFRYPMQVWQYGKYG